MSNELHLTPKEVINYRARWGLKQAAFVLTWIKPNMTILDCGCGPGSITCELAKKVYPGKITGIDNDTASLDRANKLQENLQRDGAQIDVAFVNHDLQTQWKYEDASQDLVFFHVSLAYMSDTKKVLAEAFRVLKPGGLLAAREPNRHGDLFFPPNKSWSLVKSFLKNTHRGDPYLGKKLRKIVATAGFEMQQVTGSYDILDAQAFNARLRSLPNEAKGFHKYAGVDWRKVVSALEATSGSAGWLYAQTRVEVVATKPM